jgi:uncharacterized protein (TIRG00374 family)
VTSRWRVLSWVGAWMVASGLLLASFRGVDWRTALVAASRASPFWLAAAVSVNLAIVALWACQWRLFLPREHEVPFPRMLRVTSVMAMTANSVPYLAGHLTGMHLLATRAGTGHAAALSVVTLDQAMEGLVKVTLLVLTALLVPLPQPLAAGLWVLAPAVGLLLAVTALGALRPVLLERAAARLPRRLSGLSAFAAGWLRGLASARRPAVVAGGLGAGLAMRASEALAMVMVQQALGVEVPIAGTLLVLSAVMLATMLPLAPANVGVYEGAAILAYRWVGVGAESALALALLQHLAYLAAMGGAGWAAVTLGVARASAPRVPSASS